MYGGTETWGKEKPKVNKDHSQKLQCLTHAPVLCLPGSVGSLCNLSNTGFNLYMYVIQDWPGVKTLHIQVKFGGKSMSDFFPCLFFFFFSPTVPVHCNKEKDFSFSVVLSVHLCQHYEVQTVSRLTLVLPLCTEPSKFIAEFLAALFSSFVPKYSVPGDFIFNIALNSLKFTLCNFRVLTLLFVRPMFLKIT